MRHISFPPLQKGGEGGFIGGGELVAAGRNPPRPPFFKGGIQGGFGIRGWRKL